MEHLFYAFLLLTPTVLILTAASVYDKTKKDSGASLFLALVTTVPLLWAIYHFIKIAA